MNDFASTPFPALRYNRGLHRLAMFTTLWTFFVVAMGGTVKSNEAGLTITDGFIYNWIPNWWTTPNLRLEFFHRLLVPVLTTLVIALVVWILGAEKRSSVRRFSLVLILMVILQAVIGALTVNLLAHWWISIPHAILGQSFFATLAGLTTVLSPRWMSNTEQVAESGSPSLRRLALWMLIAVFVQLLLGSALRHDEHGKNLREGREWIFHMHLGAHVLGAVAATFFIGRFLFRVFHDHRQEPAIIKPARVIMILLTFQILLGIAAAILKIVLIGDPDLGWFHADSPPTSRTWTATSHVVIGAIMLALSSVILVRTYRYVSPKAVAVKSAAHAPVVGTGVSA